MTWPNLELYLYGGLNIEPYKKVLKPLAKKYKLLSKL